MFVKEYEYMFGDTPEKPGGRQHETPHLSLPLCGHLTVWT